MRYVILLAVMLAGCDIGPPSSEDPSDYGALLVVRSSQSWAIDSDLPQQVKRVLTRTAEHFGYDPASVYTGWTINLESASEVACDDQTPPPGAHFWGCTHWDKRVDIATGTTVDVSYGCVEGTALVHELGHVLWGDYEHRDPRWADMRALQQEQIDNAEDCTRR